MKLRLALRSGFVLAVIVAVFAPSAAGACSTETYDYEVSRVASTVEPDVSTRLAPGTSVTYNYTELVNQGPQRTTALPSGSAVVPGSVIVDRYNWQAAAYGWVDRGRLVDVPVYGWVDRGSWVWSANNQYELVGYQQVSQGYTEGYYEAVSYSYDVGHTYWAAHRCWYSWGTDVGHGHFHSVDEGHCPNGHGWGYQSHANRQENWHSVIISGTYYVYRERWVDTSYSQAVYGWVDRGSWVWSSNNQWEIVSYQPTWQSDWKLEIVRWDDVSSTSAPASSTDVRNVTFDVRWKIYVARQGMSDPRPSGIATAPGSLTFNYTEVMSGCTEPT